MKNFLALFPFLAVVLLFSSCNKEDGTVDLNFVINYGGEPIVYGNEYEYTDGIKIQFDNVKYFISNIQLEESGSSTQISDVEFLQFDGLQNETLSAEGLTISSDKIKSKEYDGITMNIGLTKALNDINPADADSNSPLLDGNYWSGWGSYIFYTISGKADLDGDGVFEHNLVYHIGGKESIQVKSFDKKIDILGGKEKVLNFEFDLKEALMPGGIPFDIEAVSQLHTDRVVMAAFAENLRDALTLK